MTKFYLLSILSILLIFNNAFCQELSKEEKKAILQELKMMKKNPAQFKYLKESSAVKDVIINEQTADIMALKKELQQLRFVIQTVRDSVELLQEDLAVANGQCTFLTEGFHYRVQIGLYRDFDFTEYLDIPRFIVFERVGDLYRYSVGNFDKLSTAEYFAEEMRKLGIEGAFVSEYLDGERIFESGESTSSDTDSSTEDKGVFDPYYEE